MIVIPRDKVIPLLKGEEKSICLTESYAARVPVKPTPEAWAAYEEQVKEYRAEAKARIDASERVNAELDKLEPVLIEGSQIKKLENQLKWLEGVLRAVDVEQARVERETGKEIREIDGNLAYLEHKMTKAPDAEKTRLFNLMTKQREAKITGLRLSMEQLTDKLNAVKYKYQFTREQLKKFTAGQREKILAAYAKAEELKSQLRHIPGEPVPPPGEGYVWKRGYDKTCWTRGPETDFFKAELDRAEAAISDYSESLRKANGVPRPFNDGERAYLIALQKRESRLVKFIYSNPGFVFTPTPPEIVLM